MAMGAKELIELMLQIQERQFEKGEIPEKSAELASLREGLPPQFAGHFDRLLNRGKKAVTSVINGICKGCNMRVPAGTVLVLKKHADIQLCGNCGRYLHLPPEVALEPSATVAPKSKTRRKITPRKLKKANKT